MKKISQNTWIKIALSILGILDALLVYLPNYAAVDQGLKGRCAIFFIISVVLLWLPMELKSSIFALNFYYELGLILIIIFLMTNQMAMKFTIGLVLALLLLTWIGMVIFKNNLVMKYKDRELLIIRLVMMLVLAYLAYISGFAALMGAEIFTVQGQTWLLVLGFLLCVYYLVLAGSIWQPWFRRWTSWIMVLVAIVLHMVFASATSLNIIFLPLIGEVILLILVWRSNRILMIKKRIS
ncbi:hypothetical protein [Lactobacillus taiwanensis]|uniref:hypothetical protein n=1 Tax=Lactobacillus taiwanensis TaxID=508451 RepID=UPI000B98EC61|nr:hypothetical protein [Lactobacillus taiwanensis]MCR1915830.1 hypothetical protein [Lactobacillus taiwanensis]OYR96618.1 hypothetical protein CBF51_05305 [Lactobacillus taiwanensis]OYS01226.1 hypothetical protein CBF61_06155 [Lactobacillus taiwanensis]OYS13849.1 hypothetical protein CBF69_08235 [Lactobacillus taiwanensis]OYS32486.1 hypothetical protein CBF75_03045 [Lactobacillus taiwanensis]